MAEGIGLPGSMGPDAAGNASAKRAEQELSSLTRALSGDPKDSKRLKQACSDFESVFVQKMWEKMRATLPKDGYLHSPYEEQYLSMFDAEMAKKLSQGGGIGIGDMLYAQLSSKLKEQGGEAGPLPIRPLDPAAAGDGTLPGLALDREAAGRASGVRESAIAQNPDSVRTVFPGAEGSGQGIGLPEHELRRAAWAARMRQAGEPGAEENVSAGKDIAAPGANPAASAAHDTANEAGS